MADKRPPARVLLIPLGVVAIVAVLILASAWRGGGFGFSTVDTAALAPARLTLDGSLLLLREADGSFELVAVSLGSRERLAAAQLDRRPLRIVPTPGGVSAFVLWPDTNRVTVFDTETLEVQRDFTLDGVSRPTELSFSPNGEQVFVVDGDGSEVVEYRHQRLELTEIRRMVLAGFGPVLTNRRATRLYRATPEAIRVYFAQTGDLVETYSVATGGVRLASLQAADLRFDADYTALWGVDETGKPVVVDERTGRIASPSNAVALSGAPAAGERVGFLSTDGRSVVRVNPREPDRVEATVDLPQTALTVVAPHAALLWAITGEGSIVDVSGASARAVADLELPGIVEAISSPVDRGGSFACF